MIEAQLLDHPIVKRIAVMAGMVLITGFSAHAEDSYTFKSVLSTPSVSWCMTIPATDPNTHLVVAGCDGQVHQVFGYENATLTAGGLCVGGLGSAPNQAPTAGDPIVMAECSGGDQQAWELQPFKQMQDVFAIANQEGLCVTVDGAAPEAGTPLVLAQCAEQPTQGWVRGKFSGAEPLPEFYSYAGHRYCWYDAGWHGGGWYWCNENFHRGVGWGGPIGWHWWYHRGHPVRLRPFHPHPFHPGPSIPVRTITYTQARCVIRMRALCIIRMRA